METRVKLGTTFSLPQQVTCDLVVIDVNRKPKGRGFSSRRLRQVSLNLPATSVTSKGQITLKGGKEQ